MGSIGAPELIVILAILAVLVLVPLAIVVLIVVLVRRGSKPALRGACPTCGRPVGGPTAGPPGPTRCPQCGQ